MQFSAAWLVYSVFLQFSSCKFFHFLTSFFVVITRLCILVRLTIRIPLCFILIESVVQYILPLFRAIVSKLTSYS